MMTVAQALESFISDLELTPSQAQQAADQQKHVRAHLESGLTLERHFLSGSYARNTAIRPLNDIDLFAVLDARVHGDLRHQPPTHCLKEVRRVLDKPYPNKGMPKLQNRSVNIEFSGTGIGYDVVPAFAEGDAYWIPDRDSDSWIQSNPEQHKTFSTQANEHAGKKLKPLIKAFKHWNTQQGKLVRSFHLEVMCCNELTAPPSNYLDGLEQLFRGVANRVRRTCPEPACLGPTLDAGLTQGKRQQASERMQAVAKLLREAIELAQDGHTGHAHHRLRQVFGSDYPEKGKPGGPAPSVSTSRGRSTDRDGHRFG